MIGSCIMICGPFSKAPLRLRGSGSNSGSKESTMMPSLEKVALPADAATGAEVDLSSTGGARGLAARLDIGLPDVERDLAQRLVEAADQPCPYSRAARGNVYAAISLV